MLQELYKRVVSELGGEALAKQCEVEGMIEREAHSSSSSRELAEEVPWQRRGEGSLY